MEIKRRPATPGAWYIGIEVTNSGRLGTEIDQFGFQLSNGRHMQNIYDFLGQPVKFPMPLGPGQKATMTYAAQHIREALREEGISGKRVRPYATTGHGRIEGKKMHSVSGSNTFSDRLPRHDRDAEVPY